MQVTEVKLGQMMASGDQVQSFMSLFMWAVSAAKAANDAINAEVNELELIRVISAVTDKTKANIIKALMQNAATIFPDPVFRNWAVTLLAAVSFLG